MVRSLALLFSWKKIIFFLKKDFRDWKCIDIEKNVENFCDARFFGDKVTLRFFLRFQKKSRKNRKKCVFFEKKLMVSPTFSSKVMLSFIMQKCKKRCSKKNVKKNDFHFLKLFFLNENWTFIFVHFWFKKKL